MNIVQSVMRGEIDIGSDEIEQLAGMVRDVYQNKPNVMEIPSQNVFFVGDLHGELDSIVGVQELFQKYTSHTFVFLGDYADRGPAQIETVNLVFALALSEPQRVILLRGNHESDEIAKHYGFHYEVTSKFSSDLYSKYMEVFRVLPMAVHSPGVIFACHGGIPEGVTTLEDILRRNRKDLNFPDDILFQMAWNDPKDADFRFAANSRGMRVKSFGSIAFDEFLTNLNVRMMLRAHEVFPEGIRTFFNGRLFSIFSASYNGVVSPKVIRLGGELHTEIIPL